MKMHVISGGRLRVRRSIYDASAERGETMELPVSAFLMRHRQGNVLFDSGYHPSAAEDSEARWGGMARIMTPIAAPDDNVLSNIQRLGLHADDIDVVICSHFHSDHCGCNAFFRKATLICYADELAAARAPNSSAMGYVAADWDQPLPIREIDGEHDIFGDGRIVVIPVPGHTPGSVGALVCLNRSGAFFLASDSVTFRASLERGEVPRNTWDIDRAAKSLEEIRRIEAGGAVVICGHDDGQWNALKKGADAYD